MSYSFNVRAATKAQALVDATAKLDEVVKGQPCHALDATPALAAIRAQVALLDDDESKDVVVGVSGSLGGTWDGPNLLTVTSANVSVSAGLAQKL